MEGKTVHVVLRGDDNNEVFGVYTDATQAALAARRVDGFAYETSCDAPIPASLTILSRWNDRLVTVKRSYMSELEECSFHSYGWRSWIHFPGGYPFKTEFWKGLVNSWADNGWLHEEGVQWLYDHLQPYRLNEEC